MAKRIFCLILFFILTSTQSLKASGFALYELGARAADTSAIYYNPAGIAFLDGFRIKTNIQFGPLKSTAFSPGNELVYSSAPLQIQGQYFVTWSPFPRITFGIGRFMPYLTETNWGAGWPGKDFCISSLLISYYYRPAVAIKLTKGLALGFGVDFVFSKAEWSHSIDFPSEGILQTSTPFSLDNRHRTEGSGIGFVAGILWKIGKWLQIGGKYQHKVVIETKGNNTFHDSFLGTSSAFVIGPDGRTIGIHTLMDRYFALQNVSFRIFNPTE